MIRKSTRSAIVDKKAKNITRSMKAKSDVEDGLSSDFSFLESKLQGTKKGNNKHQARKSSLNDDNVSCVSSTRRNKKHQNVDDDANPHSDYDTHEVLYDAIH